LDSRDARDHSIRRRRQCVECGHRVTTRERLEEALPTVIKKDGSRQPFDSSRILRGLEIACRKRPVEVQVLERMVLEVEQWAGTGGERELASSAIGERIMHILRSVDPVAYIRFVSVYQSFSTIVEFSELLETMEKAENVDYAGQRQLFGESESE